MALTGFLQNGVCFSSVHDAYFDYVSRLNISDVYPAFHTAVLSPTAAAPLPPVGVQFLGRFFVHYFNLGPGGVWTYLSSRVVPIPLFPSCDPSQPFLNGVYLGGIVGLAVITVAMFAVLRRAV